jgi:expansin (peptidoglycan-binding protein)
MLFNSKTIVSIIAVLQTVTAFDYTAVNPDVAVYNNNDNESPDCASRHSFNSKTYYPSSFTTLSTVTTGSVNSDIVAADVANTTVEQVVGTTTQTIAQTLETTSATTNAQLTSQSTGGLFDSSVVHNGVATFYSVSADNCGTSSTDNDFVCAISQQMYNTVANSQSISEYCGHMINITYNGKTIQVKVVDSCESCDSEHLDLSPAAFNSLADSNLGVINIQWTWA